MEKYNICRTAIGIAVQAAKLLGLPYVYEKYTTLNEYFDINPTAHVDLTTVPDLKYFSIGRGGHRVIVDATDTPVIDPISHETTNTGPFKPVPFVLRRLNDDLSADDRAKYALRRKETHNGIDYYAYYLKRLDVSDVAPEIIHDNTVDEITTSRRFKYTRDDLFPQPSELPPVGVTVASSDTIRISSKVIIDFNERDVAEYYNVCEILYGTSSNSLISEILICSGVDRETAIDVAGARVSMKEAIGVQVVTFLTTFIEVAAFNRGTYFEFEIGEGEPLLTKGETMTTRYSPDVKPTTASSVLKGTIYDATNRQNGKGHSTTATIAADNPTPVPNPGNPAQG